MRKETWFGLWWRRSWNCRREGRVKGYDSALFWSWRAGSGERKMRAGVCGVLWGWGRWRGWEREGLVRGCLGWEGDDGGGRRLREKEVRLRGGAWAAAGGVQAGGRRRLLREEIDLGFLFFFYSPNCPPSLCKFPPPLVIFLIVIGWNGACYLKFVPQLCFFIKF
jgi:hypothetical protein